MRVLFLLVMLALSSCRDTNDDMNIPIRFDDDETRAASLAEFREKSIEYREMSDGYVYVSQSDADGALKIIQKIHEEVLPHSRSIAVPAERYADTKEFMRVNEIAFQEKRSSGMVFFVLETESDRETVERYVEKLVEEDLLRLYSPREDLESE